MTELALVALRHDRDLSSLDCGNEDMNQWLTRHAWASHKADLARTWLALDGDTVAGYFALTTGSVRPEGAPRRVARGMPATPCRSSCSPVSPSMAATKANASARDCSPRLSAGPSPRPMRLRLAWSSSTHQ